jgi:hypothetical protein
LSNIIKYSRVVCRRDDARPARTFFKLPEGFRPIATPYICSYPDGTVESATVLLGCNRERDKKLYKKRESQTTKGGGAVQFPGTFNNPRTLLRQAFREQDEIRWSGLFKGRVAMQWKVYTEQHPNAKDIKLKIQERASKLINAMWDHTTRIWHYRNDAVHSRYSKQVALFNIDALEREKERIKNKHEEMRHKLHDFQSKHLERLADIEQLHYNRHKCWADLARLYLDEAENRSIPIEATIDQYLHEGTGVR